MSYATCPRCKQAMNPNGACKPERGVFVWGADQDYMEIEWPCGDCNVAPGKPHHAGCLHRYSTKTGEQL